MASAELNHVDQVRLLSGTYLKAIHVIIFHLQYVLVVQRVGDVLQEFGECVFLDFQDGTAAVSESKIHSAFLLMLLVGS